MCRTIPGICMSLLSPLICFLYVQKIRSEIKVMIEYTSTKNIKIPVIFFYKRWWRDMHIVHVFVWNLMIGHVFFSTNLTLIYLEISCTHIIAIAENHSKEITDNWKKKYKYTCIKTQMTNYQVHKKLTTSMKQLRKILIKNFFSIVQITHNIKMPFPFKTLESHDCTS